ncbi:MAG: hypothetical protein WCW84_14285 [Sulfurimonas sp.]|jgi:hypothetical protein
MTEEELKYYSLPKLQELFHKKMWSRMRGDKWKFASTEDIYFFNDGIIPDQTILLPLPIDPDNPERGLMGMLKFPAIFLLGCAGTIKSLDEFINTPTLALLKALAHQEGVEVWIKKSAFVQP